MYTALFLFTACELKSPSMSSFLGGVESSGWLRHIKSILETSWFITQAVDEKGISVVVHCSDGWDRTAQVCSLASLLLDPYYRTIQGFQVQFVTFTLGTMFNWHIFCSHLMSKLALGPIQPPMCQASFWGVEQPGRDGHSPPSGVKVNNESSHTSASLLCLHGMDKNIITFIT